MTLPAGLRATFAVVACAAFCGPTFFASAAGAATETVVYSFQNNGKDGYFPAAALTDAGGVLYGTTGNGGSGGCDDGCGTIFSLDPATGAEVVLYSFRGKSPNEPVPGSIFKLGSKLFGTTTEGGLRRAGSLFSLAPKSGTFRTRYSFCNLYDCMDGSTAVPGLIDWRGALYGETDIGGAHGDGGVVYSFDPKTGAETTVYSFCGREACKDGGGPTGGLIHIHHILYGTTAFGGGACGNEDTCGVVFSINVAKGHETVLHTFCKMADCADGANPQGGLVEWNGLLYGVTEYGGIDNYCGVDQIGCGTVYSIDPATGAETVLYAFQSNGSDAFYPFSGLVEVNGTLYGTTLYGGAENEGAVYSIDPSTGAEAVVYSFCSQKGCPDGARPEAALLNVNGTLYGTTASGGTGTCGSSGCGTVFAITP